METTDSSLCRTIMNKNKESTRSLSRLVDFVLVLVSINIWAHLDWNCVDMVYIYMIYITHSRSHGIIYIYIFSNIWMMNVMLI